MNRALTPELASALARATRIVARVAAGHSLAAQADAFGESGAARGAVMDLTYGTLRRYGRGDAILRALAPSGSVDPQIRALILCALYALESARYADYVAVDQAVRACLELRRPAAKGFVNALLRAFLRQRQPLEARIAHEPQARYMHPRWWVETLRAAFPQNWQAALEAGNTHPPMGLRVNRRRVATEAYLARLADAGMPARALGESALLLAQPVSVELLPGFSSGEVSVQDAGAQRAAEYLDLAAGQRVLDACAAPGGKTGHILELADVELTALDADPTRCQQIRQNLRRLGFSARIAAADCAQPRAWWDGKPFDRILADVPCSGSGIARRRPDIKWLRRAGDPARFALEQARILDALWRVLAPGGKLLYVTCSVFPEENAATVDAFCARQPSAHRLALAGCAPAQLLPGAEHDGFFFALLGKRS